MNLLLVIQSDPGCRLPHPGSEPSECIFPSGSATNICSSMGRRVRFTEDELRDALARSRSWSEALRRLRYRSAGGNWRTLQKYAAQWGISTDHFDPDAARRVGLDRARGKPRPLEEVMVKGSSYSRSHLKRRLFAEGLKQRCCEMCGQIEIWRGRRLALILDHINGVPDDHRLSNLRILCPNYAATLDTHCGNKNKLPRVSRDCHRCGQARRSPRMATARRGVSTASPTTRCASGCDSTSVRRRAGKNRPRDAPA